MDTEDELQLKSILGSARDAFVLLDENGTIEVVNSETEKLFGYTERELLGKSILTLVALANPTGEDDNGGNVPHQFLGLRKDGTTFPTHFSLSEIWMASRRLFNAVFRDNTELHERQAQWEGILNSAVDAIITIDEQGSILSLNKATERLFGFTADEMYGKNISFLMPTPYREKHDDYLNNYVRTGVRKIIGIGREVTGLRKDKSTFPMHLAVSEIQVGNRRLFTGVVRDISDLKKAEQELLQLNEQLELRVRERTRELHEAQEELILKERLATLGQVSGGIAHEIRNPLNAVKTSAYYLMNAKNPSQEKTYEHLQRIDRQVTLIDNVVTALSDVARMPEPELHPQDVRFHIEDVLKNISLPMAIELVLQIPETFPAVMADPNQLPIVFRNLVRNAGDAMPHGGTLTIGGLVDGNEATIFIRDSGIGISPEQLSRITEPLYSTKARGMGLGLAISKAIIHKNRGQLRIVSELGKGSTFSVVLTAATDTQ